MVYKDNHKSENDVHGLCGTETQKADFAAPLISKHWIDCKDQGEVGAEGPGKPYKYNKNNIWKQHADFDEGYRIFFQFSVNVKG